MSQKLYNMKFAAVYLALIAKVERKGGKAESVHQVTSWLTGYEVSDVLACLDRDVTYGDFFRQAPYYVLQLQGRFAVSVLRKLMIL
ncbi:Lin0147 [Streptococcus pneumoniae]|nr:Lin0147 [Streptococcus pneumoniae]